MFGLIRALFVMFIASVLVGGCLIGCEQSEIVHHNYIHYDGGDASDVPGSIGVPEDDENIPSDIASNQKAGKQCRTERLLVSNCS